MLVLTVLGPQGAPGSDASLHCASKINYSVRITTVAEGCFLGEASLGTAAITTPKSLVKEIHPKVELRFKVARAAAKLEGIN